MQALKMALPGFLIPYVVVYNPALLLQGSLWEIAWVSFTTLVGVIALAGAVIGFFSARPDIGNGGSSWQEPFS